MVQLVQLVQLTEQVALHCPMVGTMQQIFGEICTVKPNVVADLASVYVREVSK